MHNLDFWKQVLCNHPNSPHGTLVGLAITAILLLLGSMATTFTYAVFKYPVWVRNSHHHRLTMFRFLFVRFNSAQYWFALPLLARNVLLAFGPIMTPDPALQVFIVAIFVMAYMLLQQAQPPQPAPFGHH